MAVLAGTSGYDYDAWRGSFYPDELPRSQRLAYYAGHFRTVEVNYSFYRKPAAELLQRWAEHVPENFKFALKAWQRITHQARLREAGDLVRAFSDAARTLGSRLAPILYQLPPSLKRDAPLLRDFLNQLPRDLPAAFEFRNESWFADDTLAALSDAGAALCIADDEGLSTPRLRTAPFGYLRLRRESYGEAELRDWAEFLRGAGFRDDVFVYFKHEDEARGPKLAQALLALL